MISKKQHTNRPQLTGRRKAFADLKQKAQSGDVISALDLLMRSIELGHSRLTLYRYYYAKILLSSSLAAFEQHCERLAEEVGRVEAMRIQARAADRALMTFSGKHAPVDAPQDLTTLD